MANKVGPRWWLGFILGALMPALGTLIVLEARPELMGIQRLEGEIIKHINTQIITLGMIINAALFFVFLRFKREEVSQGILFISVIYLIVIFAYRFLF